MFFHRGAPQAEEQSLARRQFNARQSGTPAAIDDIAVADVCAWDEDEIAQAIATAQALMDADPEGARQLLAQAQAAQRRIQPEVRVSLKAPFDPMRMYADVAKHYGFADSDMEQMHFPRFFGYLREAQLHNEREKQEVDRIKRQGAGNATYTPGPDGMGMEGFAVATPYAGETVAI